MLTPQDRSPNPYEPPQTSDVERKTSLLFAKSDLEFCAFSSFVYSDRYYRFARNLDITC
jgi:hypothetical protein